MKFSVKNVVHIYSGLYDTHKIKEYGGAVVKNPLAKAGNAGRRLRFHPWVRKIPWRRKW